MYEEKLKDIKQQIDRGVAPPPEIVRTFVTWFGFKRRGRRAVTKIRQSLEKTDLETDPDFEFAYFDGPISFIGAGSKPGQPDPQGMFRIGSLASANRKPKWIQPDKPLAEAVTLMLTNDFSQLPVMTTERDVKGAISWKTIGSRLALNRNCAFVRDCMETPRIVEFEESLFSVIADISEHDYVLVRAADRTICGIVTAADFSEEFRKLGEPFLLVGAIETSVRKLIDGKFTASELAEVVKNSDDKDRKVDSVTNLQFGDYVRLLENEKRWKKIGLPLDRTEFRNQLDEIREIRNDIAHYEPAGIADEDLKTLRDFFKFMTRLRTLGAI